MKSLLLAITFALSASAFASTPATTAVTALLANGEYYGTNGSEKCSVKVVSANNAVSVFITTKKNSVGVTVVDSTSSYIVNETTGEVSATQKITSPHYLQGAAKVLNMTTNDNDEVEVYISTIATNHKGDDLSSYTSCNVAK